MATVPQYKRETKLNGTPQPYNNVQVNGDMFGENIAKAGQNMAKSLQNFGDAVIDIKNTIDTAHLMELANSNEKWEQENLFDKEKGYYYKTGKDAAGKSKDVLDSYDKAMQKEISKYSFSPANMRKAQHIIDQKRTRVSYGVNAHDFRETKNYATNELNIGLENAINTAVNLRNKPEDIQKQIANGYTIIDLNGQLMHTDETSIALQKKAFESKVHESVLSSLLADNSLQASAYLEKHKDKIDAAKLPNYIQAVKDNELSYTARTTAQGLLNMTTANAYEYINGIENPTVRNAVEQQFNHLKHQQDVIQNDIDKQQGNAIMQQVYDAYSSGSSMGEIMTAVNQSNMSLEAKKAILSNIKDMQELEGAANYWVDYNSLLDLALEDNAKFKTENLAKYRLTKEQFNSLSEMQRNSANVQYSTEAQLKKIIKSFDTAFNPQTSRGLTSSEYEKGLISLLEKMELMQGKAFNINNIKGEQLTNLIEGFDYKDKNAPNKNIDETKELFLRAKKHGDIESFVAKEYQIFKHKYKTEPKPEQIYEMVKRGYSAIETQYKNNGYQKITNYANITKNVNQTMPKAGETKVLTYFADTTVPAIGRKLNLKLTMVDGARYRAGDSGGHGKGYKCDISMSEHSQQNRYRITEEILADTTTKTVGTSDPLILKRFAGHPKIVDLRNYDMNYKKTHPNTSMNHVNHLDIVLDTRFGGTQQGAVRKPKTTSPVKVTTSNLQSSFAGPKVTGLGNINKPKVTGFDNLPKMKTERL